MRILVVILSILLATTALGCIAGQREPTPNPQANADDQREAAKQAEMIVNATVEAEVKTALQVQEAVRSTMEARNGEQATEPAPTTLPTPWTESPTPMVVQWPAATVSPEEARPTDHPTPNTDTNTDADPTVGHPRGRSGRSGEDTIPRSASQYRNRKQLWYSGQH